MTCTMELPSSRRLCNPRASRLAMMWRTRLFRSSILPLIGAGLGVAAGCAPFDPPSVAEAPLALSGERVVVERLHCGADGGLLAAGFLDSMTRLEGVALLSVDHGATWQPASIEPRAIGISLATVPWPAGMERESLFLSGYRIGASIASAVVSSRYAAGPWWSTADGGRSWYAVAPRMPLPPTTDIGLTIPTIVVADAKGTLVTAADDGRGPLALLRSIDGGATWSRQSIAGLTHFGSIVTDGRGWLALTGRSTRGAGFILWSDDSGATWTESEISTGSQSPIRVPEALKLYRGPGGALVAFNSDALGKGRSHAWLFSSTDEGRSWRFVQGFERAGRVIGIGSAPDGRLIAVTEWGRVLRGDQLGTRWLPAESSIDVKDGQEITGVIFAPRGVMIAVHYRGVLHRSTDGGRSWKPVDSRLPDRQYALNANCVGQDGLIVIAGSGGMLARSLDAGATWQPGRIAATTNQPR